MISVRLSYLPSGLETAQANATNYNRASTFNGGLIQGTDLANPNNVGAKPFIVGSSILGTDYTYTKEYNGLFANCGSGDTYYDNSHPEYGYSISNNIIGIYTITISGNAIDYIKITFDKVDNQYATVMSINGTTVYNTEPEFQFVADGENTLTIQILAWNAPNLPIRVSNIQLAVNLTFDRNTGLLRAVRGNQVMADNVQPSYGMISQYGDVEIIDYQDIVFDLVRKNKIRKDLTVEILRNDVVIGTYLLSEDFDYDIYTKDLKMTLKDDILKWQGIEVEKRELSYNATAYTVFEYLRDLSTGYTFNISADDMAFMQSITIPYFYLEKGSLWEQWVKLCQLTQCNIFKDPYGVIQIKRFQ